LIEVILYANDVLIVYATNLGFLFVVNKAPTVLLT